MFFCFSSGAPELKLGVLEGQDAGWRKPDRAQPAGSESLRARQDRNSFKYLDVFQKCHPSEWQLGAELGTGSWRGGKSEHCWV